MSDGDGVVVWVGVCVPDWCYKRQVVEEIITKFDYVVSLVGQVRLLKGYKGPKLKKTPEVPEVSVSFRKIFFPNSAFYFGLRQISAEDLLPSLSSLLYQTFCLCYRTFALRCQTFALHCRT